MNVRVTKVLFEGAVTALGPLDRARGAVLSLGARAARPLLRDRGLRVLVLASLSVTVAFLGAWFFPMVLLALGPIALGVPHLLSDVRYLVALPGLHRRAAFWVLVVGPLGVVYSRPEVWVGLVCAMGAAVIARTTVPRKAAAVLTLGALAIWVHGHRGVAEIWMAHAHNIVALVMWTLFFRGRSRSAGVGARRHLWVALLFALLGTLLFVMPLRESADTFAGLTLDVQMRSLSPVVDPELSFRFVLFFAFAQSVHYAVWLRAVPDEARQRAGIRSFASTTRALRADVGPWILGAFVAGFVGIAAWALRDLVAARTGYLRLAISHGYLEIAVAALFLLEKTTSSTTTSTSTSTTTSTTTSTSTSTSTSTATSTSTSI